MGLAAVLDKTSKASMNRRARRSAAMSKTPRQHKQAHTRCPGSRLCMGLCMGLLLVATAQASEPHENILAVASDFITAEAQALHGEAFEIHVTPGRLDPRLRLRECEAGLQAFMAPGARLSGSSTAGVRCLGPVTWSLYVPVRISVMGDVLVLAQPQPRGTLLDVSQLRLERHDVGSLPGGYLNDPKAATNMVLRRALSAGTVLTPQMVEPQRLVRRGQRVTLLAEGSAIAVRVEGEALGDGSRGEQIRVRNLSSRRVVEGIVLSHGVVSVRM